MIKRSGTYLLAVERVSETGRSFRLDVERTESRSTDELAFAFILLHIHELA